MSDVGKQFGDTVAVRDLDLTVPRGSMYGLLGPNGAGKTTTIRMMLDILGPDVGTVDVFGRRIDDEARSRIGYLPEERGLYQKMEVLDQIVFLAVLKGMDRAEARRAGGEWLERLELSDWADSPLDELSKGMQQKVQFISTIIHGPDLLILDEPFSGLDPINVDLLRTIVLERNRAGTTVLLSTHMIEDAEELCSRVCMIAGARKVLDGEIDEVRSGFGGSEVEVELAGDPGDLADAPGVLDVSRDDGRVRVRVEGEDDAQSVLRRALDAGAQVRRVETVQPSLRQIFLEMAREKGMEEEARGEDAAAGRTGPPGGGPISPPGAGPGDDAADRDEPAARAGRTGR
jgi:ABC-2 type transport system ATP-binding protein